MLPARAAPAREVTALAASKAAAGTLLDGSRGFGIGVGLCLGRGLTLGLTLGSEASLHHSSVCS